MIAIGHPRQNEDPHDALKRLFEQTHIVDEWKKGNWSIVNEWLGSFDIR